MKKVVFYFCYFGERFFVVGTGNLYGGGCFVVRGVVPKVVRYIPEIRYIVDFRTKFPLIVLCFSTFCRSFL